MQLYYDSETQQRHNAATLRRTGKRPDHETVYLLRANRPEFDPRTHSAVDSGRVVVSDDYCNIEYDLVPRAINEVVDDLKVKVEAHRWKHQAGGFVYNGSTWHTDAGGRAAIDEALALAERFESANGAGTWSTSWKTKSGWVSLNLAELTAAALAMGAYVQACFAREHEIVNAMESAAAAPEADAVAVVTVYDAEINTGWPENGLEPVV